MLTAMGDVMREAYKRGWVTTRDGNISVLQGGKFYITPSGVRKYNIHPENIVQAQIIDDQVVGINQYASIEGEMHRLILNQPKTKAVVHLHPTYTIAAMYAGFDLQRIAAEFVELRRYTKVGPTVPILESGSKDLAEMTAEAIRGFDIVGQKSHGVTSRASNPWDAFEHIERLEHICKIVLSSGVRPDNI